MLTRFQVGDIVGRTNAGATTGGLGRIIEIDETQEPRSIMVQWSDLPGDYIGQQHGRSWEMPQDLTFHIP
jgi:hypothetical protein